jgi:hypothetical protein
MVEGEACHFCAACGAHNETFVPPAACKTTPSTRYVVFVCPFLSCFILSTENLHPILATIAVAARHFLHRAERHFRDTRSVQNDDLDEVRDLQLPFFSRVLNQRTTYYIRCLCYVLCDRSSESFFAPPAACSDHPERHILHVGGDRSIRPMLSQPEGT